jgi:hypothetical protein
MLIRIVGLLFALSLSVRGAELSFDFGRPDAGVVPPGFTNVLAGEGSNPLWLAVVDNSGGASNGVVITRPTRSMKDEHFPMCVYQRQKFDDFTLTTRFKIEDGIAEQMAGIVFRFQDEKNFYVIRASALGNNLRFYKVVGGIRSQPIGPSLPIKLGEWHELKIECRVNKIRAWLNGLEALPELKDTSFTVGKIGFWTKSDSVVGFGETRIEYVQREPFAAGLVRDALKENPRLVGLKIYVNNDAGEPRIIASKDRNEVGAAGGASEKGAIASGEIFLGKDRETVSVIQPLRDRNGEPIAAVRVVMKAFPGQIDQAILQRAIPIVKAIQARVQSLEELN